MSCRLAAVVAAIALIGPTAPCLAQSAGASVNAAPSVSEADREAFRAQAQDAGEGELMAMIRQVYPEDYMIYEGDMILARKAGASRAELGQRAFQFGAEVRKRVEPYVKQAPTSDLLAFLRDQAELIDQTRTVSPRACYEAVERGGVSPEAAQALTPTIARRFGAAGQTRLRVALKGKANPVARERPSTADYAAAKTAFLAAGGDPAWLAALQQGAPREQSDERRCHSALAYLKGLLSLPPEQAGRLAAF